MLHLLRPLCNAAHVQNVNHEHGGGDGVLSNSPQQGQPVRQPPVLVIKHCGVQVELVVQQDIDAIVCQELDHIHQAVEGGADIQIVTADTYSAEQQVEFAQAAVGI